jgi:hypothetical protein
VKRKPCQCAKCYDKRTERFVNGALSFDEFIQATMDRPTPAPASCSVLQREATPPRGAKRVIWAIIDTFNRFVR